jgi:GTPase involved in cell partitioning and DNA repair
MAKRKKNAHPGTAPAAAPTGGAGGAGGSLIAQQTYSNIGTFLRVPRAHDLRFDCRLSGRGRALGGEISLL